MLPGDTVLVPSAAGHGSKAAKKCQPILMLSITHTGDAHICPGGTQPWTCLLHSFVGHRRLCSSCSLLHFLYLILPSGALNKGTPSHPSISQSGLSPLFPLWGPQGQMGSRGPWQSIPPSRVQDQPQEELTPLPISNVAGSSKRSLSCVPCSSHCWCLCWMWFLWNPGYPEPCPAWGMLDGRMAQPGLSHTRLPQGWPLVALGGGCCAWKQQGHITDVGSSEDTGSMELRGKVSPPRQKSSLPTTSGHSRGMLPFPLKCLAEG